eukprot:3675872-Pyramimonas_sp.AAC.1
MPRVETAPPSTRAYVGTVIQLVTVFDTLSYQSPILKGNRPSSVCLAEMCKMRARGTEARVPF